MTPEQEKFYFNVKVGKYLAERKKLLGKYGLTSKMVIAFPKHKRVPFLGKVAIWLIQRKKGIIDLIFKNIA